MPIFLDIFHYLQAVSPKYPYIDYKIIRSEVIDKMPNVNPENFLQE